MKHAPVRPWLLIVRDASFPPAPDNLPIPLYGDSLAEVGAVSALFRAQQAVPPSIVVVDGITTKPGAREIAMRARLGFSAS